MEQAQVYASAWSLIGGVFDHGNALETAEHEKAELRNLVGKTVATLEQHAAACVRPSILDAADVLRDAVQANSMFAIGIVHGITSLASGKPIAPLSLEGLRRAILTPREIMRDEDGMLSNPAVPYLDEDVNYETFFAAFGIEAAFIHMENDVDCDTYDQYFASNSANCSFWMPSAPAGDGWLLLEIYDTEDGPVALYVREKKRESMRDRLKREAEEHSPATAPYHWNPVYNTDPVQRACAELPDGWGVNACMERDAGWVEVYGPDGEEPNFETDADHFDWQIHEAIDFAIEAARKGDAS
ncbi:MULTISPECIES: hypothetical protein [Burkholderia]|uniref:Uncharacterized protein n=1 Tax=Burkholderia contaminans TaxID=488447 RepID=A0A2S5DRE0_9BURK|nr:MULTISPECIES: hypothetical protein [Burkholderia]EKS9798264.1 hypothetical protein [Burkholderia cepacia]EKS9805748.1 hypothetical protein [Burkholderia cepacia]EKS9813103.1 hypothetical protein [Burkholderia cepacia]EKS9822115.1 hypothetical protein [Burkholderia cepacia]EKS9827344.1 hypothetical protein [Burkholderia cepacia]